MVLGIGLPYGNELWRCIKARRDPHYDGRAQEAIEIAKTQRRKPLTASAIRTAFNSRAARDPFRHASRTLQTKAI
jgi:hypothetical protein